jgi:hypothetical protein
MAQVHPWYPTGCNSDIEDLQRGNCVVEHRHIDAEDNAGKSESGDELIEMLTHVSCLVAVYTFLSKHYSYRHLDSLASLS